MTLNVVITGANRGIGLALTELYCARGYHVFAICRKTSYALNQTPAEVIENIDVQEEACLTLLTEKLQDIQVDLLINNAGIFTYDSLDSLSFDDVEQQLSVNTIGPLRVTLALLKNLRDGAKVGLITSRMGSISDNNSGGYYGYRMSKAALNAMGKSLAVDLKIRKIAVAILHPGFVQTEMVSHQGDISANTAAQRLSRRIDELTLHNSGSFWHSNGDLLTW